MPRRKSRTSEQKIEIEIDYDFYQQINNKNENFDWNACGVRSSDFISNRWRNDDEPIEYENTTEINIATLDLHELKTLKAAVYSIHKDFVPRGAKTKINKYLSLQEGKIVRASGAEQMCFLMQSYIALEAARFWLVVEQANTDRFFLASSVDFTPACTDPRDYRPAYITIRLKFTSKGRESSTSIAFANSECRGKTPKELLNEEGYRAATAKECLRHDAEFERYVKFATQVGLQVKSVGTGISHSDYGSNEKNLGVNGNESILVIDVADDSDEDDSNMYNCERRHKNYPYLFQTLKAKATGLKILEMEDDDFDGEQERYVTMPVKPLIKCFDLRRHTHYSLHINHIEKYIYDKNLDEKLVIDDEVKELIGLLSRSQSSGFKDVVAGKTGGTTVLLAGPPGVGKTLTAEIFSEAVERPLYRVQCSQLGTDPDELEQKLLKVFRRAARWKAIILLDESDVYVAKRGDCLEKNAIVGVFLRVLEYQESVMFMTTNLPESVDDAIASRCIARIDYSIPKPKDLNKIWDILSTSAGMELDWTVRSQITAQFPHLSGRDVKNILKLIAARGQAIDLISVQQAAKFHPNRGNWNER